MGLSTDHGYGKSPGSACICNSSILTFFEAAINARRAHELARQDLNIISIKECCAIYSQLYMEQGLLPQAEQHELSMHIVSLYSAVIKYIMVAWEHLTSNRLGGYVDSYNIFPR